MVKLEPVVLQIPTDTPDASLQVCLVRAITADGRRLRRGAADGPRTAPGRKWTSSRDAVANTDPLDFNLTWQRLMALLREYEPDPLADYVAVLGAIDVARGTSPGGRWQLPCHRLAGGLRARRIDCTAGGLSVTTSNSTGPPGACASSFAPWNCASPATPGVTYRPSIACARSWASTRPHGRRRAGLCRPCRGQTVGQALEQVEAFGTRIRFRTAAGRRSRNCGPASARASSADVRWQRWPSRAGLARRGLRHSRRRRCGVAAGCPRRGAWPISPNCTGCG